MRRILLIGLALCAPGCGSAGVHDVSTSPIVPCVSPSGPPAPGTSEALFLENSRSELRLVGLRPLALDTLPPGARELRLWHSASWVGVTSLLRIRTLGDSVAGDLMVFAGSVIDTPPDGEAPLPARCRLLNRAPGRLACIPEFRRPVSWTTVLDSLEAHQVWTLPRGADLPREHFVTDGGGIFVEVRQSSCYRAYSYYVPESESTPEYRHAAALSRILFELRQQ